MPNTNEEDQIIVLLCLFTGRTPDHLFAPWPVLPGSEVEHLTSMPENTYLIPLPVEVHEHV